MNEPLRYSFVVKIELPGGLTYELCKPQTSEALATVIGILSREDVDGPARITVDKIPLTLPFASQ